MAAASVWELLAILGYQNGYGFVEPRPWVLRLTIMGKTGKEVETLEKQLWEVCRDKKDAMTPRITNQQIAEDTGLSVNTVSQYLRGETKNAPLATFGPICRMLGVSVDEYLGIARSTEIETHLSDKLDAAENLNSIYVKSIQKKDALIMVLLLIVLAAMAALIIDIASPTVGWIRDTASDCKATQQLTRVLL